MANHLKANMFYVLSLCHTCYCVYIYIYILYIYIYIKSSGYMVYTFINFFISFNLQYIVLVFIRFIILVLLSLVLFIYSD